jgi:hypothetical protein
LFSNETNSSFVAVINICHLPGCLQLQVICLSRIVTIVRMALFFNNPQRPILSQVVEVLQRLQNDPQQLAFERDGRYNEPPRRIQSQARPRSLRLPGLQLLTIHINEKRKGWPAIRQRH